MARTSKRKNVCLQIVSEIQLKPNYSEKQVTNEYLHLQRTRITLSSDGIHLGRVFHPQFCLEMVTTCIIQETHPSSVVSLVDLFFLVLGGINNAVCVAVPKYNC